jgi:hypothetical protein
LTIFFIAYGLALFFYSRWLAQTRVAALGNLSRFPVGRRIFAFIGVLLFATAPPLANLVYESWSAKTLNDFAFLAFVAAWIISAVPGIAVSRKILKAAGIDPDKEL